MKFWEALKNLQEGKKVRNKDWVPRCFWSLRDFEYKCGSGFPYHWTEEEWELYEEPGLTFAKVIEGLKAGKKFRRRNWFDKSFYINWRTPDDLILDSFGDMAPLTIHDYESTDWEEVR